MRKNKIRTNLEKKPEKKEYFTLQWHILERCNLRCKHCYQNEDYIKKELSLSEKKEIIDEFVRFCSKIEKTPKIAFTGGEPFLIKKELYLLLDYCKKNYPFLETSILTNGTLITLEDALILKSKDVKYIQVSLDGASEKTHDSIRGKGNFEKALNTLHLLNKEGIKTAVMSVFHKKNYKEVPALIDLCDKLNVDFLGITELVPTGRGKKMKNLSLSPLQTKELFIKIAKKQVELIHNKGKLQIDMKRPLWVLIRNKFPEIKDVIGGGCAAGFSGLALMPDGDVMACRRINKVIGNIKKQSFFEIWYSSPDLWELRERDKLGECSACKYNELCSGCKAISLSVYGNYFKKDIHCWYKND